MRKMLFCVLIFIALGSLPATAQSYLVQLRVENHHLTRAYLEGRGYDVAGYNCETKELGVITDNPKSLEQLQGELRERQPHYFAISSITPSSPFRNRITLDNNYFDAEKILQDMRKMEQLYPKWAKVYDLNHWLGIPATEEGRHIYALQISVNPGALEDEPKALFIGLHHCREVMTHHAVLDAAWDLLKGAKEGNSPYRAWIEDSAAWFVPAVNPDGLEYVFSSNNMWRKNRSHNSGGSRGVDLNRNYRYLWGACGSNSSNGSSNVYKGPAPASEPEVQVMDQLNAKLHCQYIISYHSYGNEVLYPYKCATMAEADVYYTVRDSLAKRLGFGKRYASSSGEDFEHHYHHYGTISFLLEIGNSFQPSFSTYRNKIWPTVQKVLPFVMEELHNPVVHINISEMGTGKPLSATIEAKEINFSEGESRVADEYGSYWWRLLPGTYHFTVKMKGYHDKSFVLKSDGKPVEYRVELDRSE